MEMQIFNGSKHTNTHVIEHIFGKIDENIQNYEEHLETVTQYFLNLVGVEDQAAEKSSRYAVEKLLNRMSIEDIEKIKNDAQFRNEMFSAKLSLLKMQLEQLSTQNPKKNSSDQKKYK